MLLRSRILVFQLIFTGHAVNVAVDLRGEFARGVEAVLLLAVVHRCQLHDRGEVTARTDGNGDLRHGHIKDGRVVFVETQTVIEFVILPLFKLDYKVDLRLILHCTHAEELFHVDYANAAHLKVVADELRRRARER